jgi:hypothetical protein
METRTINQVKVHVLRLNDMRMPQVEQTENVAFSFDEKKLTDWANDQKCESYSDEVDDGRWGKSFKKGSKLEWYNPPSYHFNQGITSIWIMEDEISQLRYKLMEI